VAASLKAVDLPYDSETLGAISALVTDLLAAVGELESALGHEGGDSSEEHARYAKDTLIPPMVEVRTAVDRLEGLVADDLWPLPTYQEMLNIL
jgi:glutamine synthetase